MKKILLLSCVVLLLNSADIFAQCSMYELPFEQKVKSSTDIFEGKVVSSSCFWDASHRLIFTSNIVELYKVFKGNITSTQVEIITEGGTIDDQMQTLEPNIGLNLGDIGIFMTEASMYKSPANSSIASLQCYGSSQGFFKYDPLNNTATVPFRKYTNIQSELYDAILKISNVPERVINAANWDQQNNTTNNSIPKSGGGITGFSPTSITGGTYSVLTIDGAGFGATRNGSNVWFKNPDDGGNTYKKAFSGQYISWSDTQIKVRVPAKAGTGTIQVVVGANTYTSASPLTVNYSEINNSDTVSPYQTDLVTLNATGGITWQMYTAFDSNTVAKNAFNRALQNWSNHTNINWGVGVTTTKNSIGYDSVSVVRFDIGNELPAGTLARCYYYWFGCNAGTVWFVSELDMSVDDAAAWEFGPATPNSSSFDFESVMLHELGHGHQLCHVIDVNDVMHYSSQNGTTRRVLSANNIAGGTDIINRSAIGNSCGYGPMIMGINNLQLPNKNTLITYPNPTSGMLSIELQDGEMFSNADIYNPFGGLVYSIHQNNNSKLLKIDLSGLSNGMYYVVVHSQGKTFTKKIVLTK